MFFIPGVVALTYAGYFYAAESWAINEHSNITADGPPIYPFKTDHPARRARSCCCRASSRSCAASICLKQGEWPSREEDVEEVDVDKLKEMVHVKDEDIEKLDALVPAGGRAMKMRKELWFGFTIMAIILATAGHASRRGRNLTNGHLGLLMLALVVVAIMLGFPTAFTLMGMGVFFAWLSYRSVKPGARRCGRCWT